MHPLPRSLLFVPAASQRKIEKALASAADGVILDLEDSVTPGEKPQARQATAAALAGARVRPMFVRVNAATTPFCYADLQAVVPAAPDGIMLPKVERASELETIDWVVGQLEAQHGRPSGSIEILPIIETAAGIAAADAISRASPRVRQLAFGAVDLALDMDLDLADESGALAHARFALAVASRAAGLQGPFDTAFIDIQDLDRLRASALRARAMGYQGKACIHPAQIATVNAVFTPSDEALARARRLVEAFEAAEKAGSAAVSVDGTMVDYPVAERARRVIASHGSRSARPTLET